MFFFISLPPAFKCYQKSCDAAWSHSFSFPSFSTVGLEHPLISFPHSGWTSYISQDRKITRYYFHGPVQHDAASWLLVLSDWVGVRQGQNPGGTKDGGEETQWERPDNYSLSIARKSMREALSAPFPFFRAICQREGKIAWIWFNKKFTEWKSHKITVVSFEAFVWCILHFKIRILKIWVNVQ